MNYLVLVNKNNLIKNSYFKNLELVNYFDIKNENIQIEKQTKEAYLELKSFLETKNIEIGIDSCYRTLEEQQNIVEEFTIKYGEEYANNFVASVGTSEHHTGLAIDLSIKVGEKFLVENEDLFTNENIFLEIHRYLKDFGFILRYPKGKEKITSYDYEPWHIRYVGKIVANIIYENNLTLEEYLNNFSGILVINKEKGVTSRDVVNEISKIFGIKKIGHTGTLDPIAQGVLVLTIGKATKIGELLTSFYKEYIASVVVGTLTDTLDITGKILKEKDLNLKLNYDKICSSFKKRYLQEVPIYSAVKVRGKKLYEYARNNEIVELPKKEVDIKEIQLLESTDKSFKFRTLVSKGTYIRSLIRDMGDSVSQYFSMSDLIRTKQGDFSIDMAYTLEDIKNNKFKIFTLEQVLNSYPILEIIDQELAKKIKNGCKLDNVYDISDKVLFKYNGEIIAIYEAFNGQLKVWKML